MDSLQLMYYKAARVYLFVFPNNGHRVGEVYIIRLYVDVVWVCRHGHHFGFK